MRHKNIKYKKMSNIAAKIAAYGNVKRAKVSAIAFTKSGHVITSATNRRVDGHKRHWTQHAEENLISKLRKLKAFDRFSDISILVVRINTSGLSISKPCKRCSEQLRNYDIKVLYISNKGEVEKMNYPTDKDS